MKLNALNWFEIYVTDIQRARTFYETILNTQLVEAEGSSIPMAIFPYDNMKGIGGSITCMEGCKPGPGGTVIYLNVEGDLDGVISRIPAAGGKVIRPRFAIPPHGFIAIFEDTEGNVVGLHSLV
ncbi:MAG: VOC family protein [Prosthecobacter sp.]|nr:VOC family protein [Prosthecobacter sp.]